MKASYATDGVTFVDIGSAIEITEKQEWTIQTIDFGTSLSGSSSAAVRITLSGGGAVWNEAHQSNLDNIAITAVPEPATYALLFGFTVLGGVMIRRRRR